MKLHTVKVIAPRKKISAGTQNEKAPARKARMVAYWKDSKNAVLYSVGNILAMPVDVSGKTIAQVIADGKTEVELDSLTLASGQVLDLKPGYKFSLRDMRDWRCPACHSAHGSGVYPSKQVNSDLLADANAFYYNPKTRDLFTISTSCWGSYVKALGAATRDRFLDADGVPAPVTVGK